MTPDPEPFQGPDNLDYEFLGYFEEWHDVEWNKHLGTRRVEKADRLLGVQGARTFTLTENVALDRGHKKIVVRASVKRPMQVRTVLNLMCGNRKEQV